MGHRPSFVLYLCLWSLTCFLLVQTAAVPTTNNGSNLTQIEPKSTKIDLRRNKAKCVDTLKDFESLGWDVTYAELKYVENASELPKSLSLRRNLPGSGIFYYQGAKRTQSFVSGKPSGSAFYKSYLYVRYFSHIAEEDTSSSKRIEVKPWRGHDVTSKRLYLTSLYDVNWAEDYLELEYSESSTTYPNYGFYLQTLNFENVDWMLVDKFIVVEDASILNMQQIKDFCPHFWLSNA